MEAGEEGRESSGKGVKESVGVRKTSREEDSGRIQKDAGKGSREVEKTKEAE